MEPEGEYGGGGTEKAGVLTEQSQGRKDPQPQAGSSHALHSGSSASSRQKPLFKVQVSHLPRATKHSTEGSQRCQGQTRTRQNWAEAGANVTCGITVQEANRAGVILTGGARRWCLRGNRRGWSSGHLTGFTELYSMNTPLGVGGWCLAGLTVCADQVPGGRAPRGSGVSHRGSGVTADGR